MKRLLEGVYSAPRLEISDFPEYDFSSNDPTPLPNPATARILTFQATKLKQLKAAVTARLSALGFQHHISTADCLGGLIWTSIARARQPRLSNDAILSYAIAVDIRSKTEPPLPPSYFGNAVVHALAVADLAELVTPSGPAIDMDTIALAASRIRTALESVDDAYVHKRLALYAQVSDPTVIVQAFKRAIDMPNTGLDFSDWREQGADIEFSCEANWVRKTWSANEGAVNFLPRRGGREGQADSEVLLALSGEDMDAVCSAAGGLVAWVSRVVG